MRSCAKVWISLSALAIGAGIAEIALRVAHVAPIPAPIEKGELHRPSANPKMRYENLPGATQHTLFFDRRGELVREVYTHVNAQGWRGDPVETKKPEATLRIAIMGDSQTFGFYVEDGETWPAALQTTLRARPSSGKLEVLNCAVAGYDTEQETALLETRVLALEPDIVILGFFVNDTEMPGVELDPPPSPMPELIHFFSRDPGGFFYWLRTHSRIVDLAADWAFHRLVLKLRTERAPELFGEDFAGWVRVRAAIREMRDHVESAHARFAIVLLPLLVHADGRLLSTKPYRTVAAFCAAEHIACYDPESLFDGLDLDGMRVHPYDMHSGARANRITAEGVGRWLGEQGWLETH